MVGCREKTTNIMSVHIYGGRLTQCVQNESIDWADCWSALQSRNSCCDRRIQSV
jgi:hypothetical protein